MKTKLNVSVACGLAILMAGATAQAEVELGADVEIDVDAVSNRDGGTEADYDQGGRVKAYVSGKHESDFGYVSGVGQLILGKNGSTGVDDAYVRLGNGAWGVQMGRFEAIEVFSKGTDTVHNLIGSTNFYQGSAARGRKDDAGQIMMDYTPNDKMRFELATIYGESDDSLGDEQIFSGIRPGVKIDITDDFRVTAAYEFLEDGSTETKGFGIYARYATDAFALKANVAQGKQETGSSTDWENTSYNINIESGAFGLGFTQSDDDGGDSASTFYGRYYMPNLMGVKNAAGSLGFSAAKADSVTEDEFAVRYRVNYTF